MRIRKRTPVRAASPSPGPSPPPPPPPPPLRLPQLKGRPPVVHTDEEEEKQGSLVVGGDREEEEEDEDDLVLVASTNSLRVRSAADVAVSVSGGGGRCSRNDGKRWRCKSAAVPGYVFCDRHVAWSTSKRKPRPKKRIHSTILDHSNSNPAKEEDDDDDGDGVEEEEAKNLRCSGNDDDEEFHCYGGLQHGGRKRAKSDGGAGAGPA
uniref:WRC domain-containing protein n=1 Tax=Oryza punctata TaxID=4537 RepID=A0A0E0M856_ORYPU